MEKSKWKGTFGRVIRRKEKSSPLESSSESREVKMRPKKMSLGILSDKETDEVPGSILLMSKANHNEPLGLRNTPATTSASSLPSPYPPGLRPPISRLESQRSIEIKKKTPDGGIILEPQPDDSMNDPLNWPSWRRDVALLSLGFYCMLGGGMTPILAAGFNDVADTYKVSIPQVALTTGLYMMGLGLGSVVASPTAILFGKRPVYLIGIILYIISAIWCAASPNYPSLVIARIFMGFAVSPVECLPSATIAEIFFLHERAYRLGIYTLLLLSGKNLIPLVSAAIIQGLSWRWVFWIVAMIVGLCFALMFFFVPETFWDRTPRPRSKLRRPNISAIFSFHPTSEKDNVASSSNSGHPGTKASVTDDVMSRGEAGAAFHEERRIHMPSQHVDFISQPETDNKLDKEGQQTLLSEQSGQDSNGTTNQAVSSVGSLDKINATKDSSHLQASPEEISLKKVPPRADSEPNELTNAPLTNFQSMSATRVNSDTYHNKKLRTAGSHPYTAHLRAQPPKTFTQSLKPWNGRLRNENWFRVALRPFILFAYPAILWSTLVYSLSIGWLIVLSESISSVYKNKETYNFSSLGTGLVYISPFVGGVLGTAVAGKISDVVVRFMSRRNDGIYEPEFRLIMAIPVAISTCIGLIGYGWSAEEKDLWIVPTIFFGIISFGCSLGSTTAITFAVDSYRQYAGEALVTLNFSKNIFHGLVFSLFFNRWLEADGSKNVFLAIGIIQLACMVTTVPIYIFGKRFRMWTVRKNLMEKF